jgi:hypothetical protein
MDLTAVVVQIAGARNQQFMTVLGQWMALAEQGKLRGLLVCGDVDGAEEITISGNYRVRPALGVNAAMRVSWKLTQFQDKRFADSGFGPP